VDFILTNPQLLINLDVPCVREGADQSSYYKIHSVEKVSLNSINRESEINKL